LGQPVLSPDSVGLQAKPFKFFADLDQPQLPFLMYRFAFSGMVLLDAIVPLLFSNQLNLSTEAFDAARD